MRIDATAAAQYRRANEGGGLLNLSDRTELHLTGTDRERFLNGQITQSLRAASRDKAAYACALDARGKMCGDFFFSLLPDAIRLDADPALRESLAARLERYMIADDVELADRSADFGLIHLFGVEETPALQLAPLSAVRNSRIGIPGWDFLWPADQIPAALEALSAMYPVVDDVVAEILRIEHGVARWGAELTPDVLPVEAGLAARAIDYEKGCYLGQEIISRLKLGTPAKSLCLLVSEAPEPLPPGTEIFHSAAPGKPAGVITSSAWSFHFDKSIALGYVKRGMEQTGTILTAHSQALITITVQAIS